VRDAFFARKSLPCKAYSKFVAQHDGTHILGDELGDAARRILQDPREFAG
jgi:hypothetical protein